MLISQRTVRPFFPWRNRCVILLELSLQLPSAPAEAKKESEKHTGSFLFWWGFVPIHVRNDVCHSLHCGAGQGMAVDIG